MPAGGCEFSPQGLGWHMRSRPPKARGGAEGTEFPL